MWKEFKAFVMRGNVMDMAVGIIIGLAFGKVVTSLVNDIIMPPIGKLLGNVDFSNFFITLSGQHYVTLADAKKAGAATGSAMYLIQTRHAARCCNSLRTTIVSRITIRRSSVPGS